MSERWEEGLAQELKRHREWRDWVHRGRCDHDQGLLGGKPPLGVKPRRIAAWHRLDALAGAIARYTDRIPAKQDERQRLDLLRDWLEEAIDRVEELR